MHYFYYTSVLTIRLNGEPYEVAGPLTVSDLLAALEIDGRRVAVEHNLTVVKKDAYDTTMVRQDDQVEIVNFVGGGSGPGTPSRQSPIVIQST